VLLAELVEPPMEMVGALPVEEFIPLKARRELVASLNTLVAAPSFAAWRTGASRSTSREWMEPVNGRTPATIVSVAHLDDEERMLVLGVVLEEVLTWVRSLPGYLAPQGDGGLR
jgi:hypothetical protein